jgi:outer membrane PBP1 activator LpoA protein
MRSLAYRAPGAAIVTVLWLLAGCAALPPPASFPGATAAPSVEHAEAAGRRGDHAAAAAMYEALAASAPAPAGLQLLAGREWLNANRSVDAARVLNSIHGTLAAEQLNERRILAADVALANGQGQNAWEQLAAITDSAIQNSAAYLDARMRAALASARPVEAVRAEMIAERVYTSTADHLVWRQKLLAYMRQARERGARLEAGANQEATVRGWLDLGSMVGSGRGASLTGGQDAARWRQLYPNHPATDVLGDALPAPLTGSVLNRIALLLPLSSSSEARTMRDGFQHALNQIDAASRPQLQLYDTATLPAVEQLAAARAAGAEFIVGPLLKADVAAVAAAGTPGLPVLALNALATDDAPSGFYQFALSPEDEARDAARQILASGLKRGVALAPANEWGNRVLAAFTQELLARGGVLLAQASYDGNSHDYSAAIKQVLGTIDSETRLRRVQAITGAKYEFEPRRRADIDFIYAAASTSTTARLLRPQLGYQYAGQLPIYMSSATYTPEVRESNQDLDGAMFPDMPWRLPDATLDAARAAAEQSGVAGWRSPYFAFGYDALQLSLALAAAGHNTERVRVAGFSGVLTVAPHGRIRRELEWARVRDGTAVLMAPVAAAN